MTNIDHKFYNTMKLQINQALLDIYLQIHTHIHGLKRTFKPQATVQTQKRQHTLHLVPEQNNHNIDNNRIPIL